MNYQNQQQISALLRDGGLSEEDQQFWAWRIQAAPEETQPYIVEFLTTVPGGKEWLRPMQEKKEQALFTGDRKLWEEVLQTEEAVIPS